MESQTDGPMEGSGEQNGNGHAATGSNTPDEHPKQGGAEEAELLWKLRKYLVLMAILVAAITFQAGLAPPGGFWQETEHGRVASDVVLRSSYPRRYLVFFYCNTTAFGASLMVLMLLLLSRNAVWLRALQFAMILGLLGLMGAYAAGSCREVRTSVYIWVLLVGIFAYVTLHVVFFKHLAPKKLRILLYRIRASWKGTLGQMMTHGSGRTIDDQEAPDQLELGTRDGQEASSETERTRDDQEASETETTAEEQEEASNKRKEDLERNRSSLLVLATLVATVTYVAGLTPPGGFWSENDNNHIAGDPVLRDHYPCRFKAFLICNATAFAGSLVIIIMVLSQTAVDHVVKSNALRLCVIVSLFALMGAYAAGSCREVHTSIYVFALVGAVLLYLIIQCIEPAVPKSAYVEDTIKRVKGKNKEMVQKVRDFIAALLEVQDQADSNKPSNDDDVNGFQKLRTYLLLLGILAATVTFQAGMNPPGGFWTDNSDGHTPGNPILEVTNPKRYKAFFYCNAIAFVASLVIIILLQSQLITIRAMKRHVLQTAMALVLFGLMGAYVAGSSRKFSTSLYVFVLVLLVFAYVVLHILYERYIANTGASEAETSSNRGSSELTAEEKKEKEKKEKDLQKRRKFLMLLAILAASITYQTGISPPGGFWTDNKNGHRAGYPVFRDEFRHRYRVFFYFNATAFMASLAVILLLVSKRLCNRGLRCFALRVCVLVDLISLMGAFATGSCRKVTTSVYVILVVLAVFVYVIAQVLFLKFAKKKVNDLLRRGMSRARPSERQDPSPSMDNGISLPDTDKKRTEHKWRKDLMLIGTLAVTVTYQAGLLPPGGVWPDDRDGHFTGDPILHDTNLTRYKVFFYCNATAFMASMVMVILLLNNTISNYKRSLFAMKIAMVLNLLGLLGAFAAGSCRKFKTSVYIFALVIAVIIYIIIHVLLSFDKLARLVKKQGEEWVEWVRCLKSSAPSGTDSNNQPSSGEPGQSPPV